MAFYEQHDMIRIDQWDKATQQPSDAPLPRFQSGRLVDVGHCVESHRFWDLAQLWARETQQHPLLIARALAKGVVRQGLRLYSHLPDHVVNDPSRSWGRHIVGYVGQAGEGPMVLRADALRHLKAVVERAVVPDANRLHEEYIVKTDLQTWLCGQGLALPAFWFTWAERQQAEFEQHIDLP